VWAVSQLTTRLHDDKTPAQDRDAIRKSLAAMATKDGFWGARFDAIAALSGSKEAKDALLAATKDANSRVRARAVTSLAANRDAALADTYSQLLSDQSYAVIRATALALGQTKNPAAYDSLARLIDQPSWRDTIRASGLSGLAALGDSRALELGFKYAGAGNPAAVRMASISIVGALGKNDPRSMTVLADSLNEAFEHRNFQQFIGAADALVALGDQRALALFEEMDKKLAGSQFAGTLANYESRLKAKLAAAKPAT